MKPYEHERTKQIKWNFYLQKYFACKKNLGNNLFIYFDSHVYTSLDTPRCLLYIVYLVHQSTWSPWPASPAMPLYQSLYLAASHAAP